MKWQTMKSAPQDGTNVLLTHVEDGLIYIGYWDVHHNTWVLYHDGSPWFDPSHWMDLPEPPKAKRRK